MLKHHMFIPAIWIPVLVFWALPALAEIIVDTAWVRRYDGPASEFDEACAIAIDGSRNVYVTGFSYGSSLTNYDYATVKYDRNGNEIWVRRYNGPASGSDKPYALAVDSSGNAYVTGRTLGIGTAGDYATIKYRPSGDTAWVRTYDGPAHYLDEAYALAVDSCGNVYVTGSGYGNGTSMDYATIKYDSSGNELWVRRYNGPGNDDDLASGIRIDGSDVVYLTGYSWGDGSGRDYATIRYHSNGDTAWVIRYNGPGNGGDHAYAITVDTSDNVYVAGTSDGTETGSDYATIKYGKEGNQLWVQRYNGPGDSGDQAYAIAVDDSGNVYITGASEGDGLSYDYATIKYYPDGDTAWIRRYNGPGNGHDVALAIALDSSRNTYVTGYISDTLTGLDYATIKYSSSGDELWVRRYNGTGSPGNNHDFAYGLAVDGSNNVYVTGTSYGGATGRDYVTIKYFQALRGDANEDEVINSADVTYLISYLFRDGPPPEPLEAGNVNCDSLINSADIVYLINYLFKDGPAPCEP